MNAIFTICGIGICAVVAICVLREIHGEYVKWIVLGFAVICLSYAVVNIEESVLYIKDVGQIANGKYTEKILRALGIAYLTSIAGEVSKSVGETSICGYIEMIGKLEILLLTLPLFRELIQMVLL